MNVKGWSLSHKISLIALAVAVLSLFMPWVDLGFVSRNGFQMQGYIFLVIFIYPLIVALKNKKFHKIFGYVNAGVGVLVSIIYIANQKLEFLGESVNVSSTGAYLTLLALVSLGVAVFLDKETKNEKQEVEPENKETQE